jgi:hypothetical protein
MSDEERSRQRLQGAVGDAYRIGRLIGSGGFAEVFEAADPRLGRSVAIKALRPDLVVSRELVERFQREARAMAGLRHPHVMEIYTVGEAGGVAYFVMPLIAGGSLGGRLDREGRLSIGEATRILLEAARALDAAHRSGTIHRDIKPDNILLEGADGRVVITDFGIAKALSTQSGALTGTGMFMGTPRYVSPEQAVGDDVDHRSDIYSLGVVAFQMIAGRLPFEARSAQALVAQHLTEEAPALWTLRPECPEPVAHVVQRCLAKDPGDRWGSLADMVAVLEGRAAPPALVVADVTPESGTPVASAARHPVERLHLTALGLLGGAAVLGGVDAALGLGGISAWVALACALYVAGRAGRLWAGGHEWKEILVPGAAAAAARVVATEDLPGLLDGEFGRFGTLVHECTADRAAILKALAGMPRQEQSRFPHLQAATEGLLHRIRHLARKVTTLEERVADTAKRIESERGERDGADPAGAARYAARLQELAGARDEAATELRAAVARLEDLRDALVERLPLDATTGVLDVDRSLRLAVEYLGRRG